ncbi:MAG: hypothetical protein ACRC6V_04785 [Bacteroidales bacterium]
MARKPRWRAKREEEIKGTPYDSLLEKRLHEGKLSTCIFHDKEHYVSYSVPHTYQPDFIHITEDGRKFLIETKGRFSDSAEARKYIFVREALDEKTELVFVWQKPKTRFPFARKRLNGTYRTQEEWSEDHGFRHWCQDDFDLSLL